MNQPRAPATPAASLLPATDCIADPVPAQVEAAALLRCAVALLERGRMLTAEQQAIGAELNAIGDRLKRLNT